MINRRGFTLVELTIVIAIIAILATIAILGVNRYLKEGRDSQREASVVVISEALEKYYDQNGEYPGCTAITATGPTAAANTLKEIDQASLVVPDASPSTTNSIRCGSTLLLTGEDFFQYIGDGTGGCNGAGACLSYTIRYRDEAEGLILELNSRRNDS